jgi:FkbM family methyltransferase
VFRTLARLCRKYLQWYGNASYKPERNGEGWLLRRVAGPDIRVVLDGGANVGKWSRLAAAAFPGADIHALEIVPATFEILRAQTAGFPKIHPVNLGLAGHTGRLRIRYNPSASAHATYTEYPHGWAGEMLECAVTAGDDFLAGQRLAGVDFLKLDVEGAEHLALQGFARALAERRVRFVQFEYGRVNALTGFLLKNFYDLFAAHGYVVGKIYPDYVDFRSYDLGDEDFLGPNYLACRHEDPAVELLRGPAA